MRGAFINSPDSIARTDASGGDTGGIHHIRLQRIKISLPELNAEERHDADMILDTMLMGIDDLYQGYSDFIELEVR